MAPLCCRDYGVAVVEVVGLGRLELPTSRLSSARSNQLSYKPDEASRANCEPVFAAPTEKEGKRRRRQESPLSEDDAWDVREQPESINP